MPGPYDAFGRPLRVQIPALRQSIQTRPAAPDSRRLPTLDEYDRLAAAYQRLLAEQEQLSRRLQEGELLLAELRAARDGLQAELAQRVPAVQPDGESTWRERYVVLQAELENLRRRLEQRYATAAAESSHRVLLEMLPLADHLEMALEHGSTLDSGVPQGFLANIQATLQAFQTTLQRHGVEPLQAHQQPFDPTVHEAVSQIESEAPPDQVVRVVQNGYRVGDRLLRPAKVVISR